MPNDTYTNPFDEYEQGLEKDLKDYNLSFKTLDEFENFDFNKIAESYSEKEEGEKGTPLQDGSGPHGRGKGPGKGKQDGSGKKVKSESDEDETITEEEPVTEDKEAELIDINIISKCSPSEILSTNEGLTGWNEKMASTNLKWASDVADIYYNKLTETVVKLLVNEMVD